MAPADAPPGPPDKRSGALQLDVLYDILLLLPAKDLCRFRAVCRPWRALLCDQGFIAAHAACHPGPHIVAGYRSDSSDILCDILDLSGRVVKRIPVKVPGTGKQWLICAHQDFLFTLVSKTMTYQLLDPATGAKFVLPGGFAKEHMARRLDIRSYSYFDVVGNVASKREYKVLRIFYNTACSPGQLCQVVTLGVSKHSRWRGTKPSPRSIDLGRSKTVINGIAYFLTRTYEAPTQKCIDLFDLGKEEWGATPTSFVGEVGVISVSLAALNDCLAVVCCNHNFCLDIWFLADSERGSWVKLHSIQIDPKAQDDVLVLNPLLVLSDGRILLYNPCGGSLRIYNPSISSYTDLAQINPWVGVGLFTGSLLSLANGASDS